MTPISMLQTFVAVLIAFLALAACFSPASLVSMGRTLRTLATDQGGFMVQRINRSDPEKVFIAVKNSYTTASLTNGQAVQWDLVAADGVSVTRPTARATSAGITGAGIIAETIASASYGLMQVYGLHTSVRMREMTGGTVEPVPGRPLVLPAAGGVFSLESVITSSTTILTFPMAFMLAATASWTSSNKAAFIKAL